MAYESGQNIWGVPNKKPTFIGPIETPIQGPVFSPQNDNVDTSADQVEKNPITPVIRNSPGKMQNSGSLANGQFDRLKIQLHVDLYHNGTRYDVTPYIIQVKTHMSLDEAAGSFTLLLTFQKRWDLLVYVMDYVEISFGHYEKVAPIMMRGFVGNVRRTRIIDGSGKVHRAFTINGENFGKIWNNYYIEYLVQEIGQTLQGFDVNLSNSPENIQVMLTENYGIVSSIPQTGNVPNNDLVFGLVDKMLNPYIDVLKQVNPQIPNLNFLSTVLADYQIVNGPIIQAIDNMSVYDVMNQLGNKPWCEYFIDDYSDGPLLWYRNTPFKDENGLLVFPESDPSGKYYLHPVISDADIMEEDVGTSDNEVYSYFFTYPATAMYAQEDPRAAILGMQAQSDEQESNTINIYNPHVELDNMYRFGFKSLTIPTNSIPLSGDGSTQNAIALALKMNAWLVKSFRWSQNMKNGTLRVKGNEHLRVGRYFTQSSTKEEYYIETVDHEITISQTESTGDDNVYKFETTLGVTRGRNM